MYGRVAVVRKTSYYTEIHLKIDRISLKLHHTNGCFHIVTLQCIISYGFTERIEPVNNVVGYPINCFHTASVSCPRSDLA